MSQPRRPDFERAAAELNEAVARFVRGEVRDVQLVRDRNGKVLIIEHDTPPVVRRVA